MKSKRLISCCTVLMILIVLVACAGISEKEQCIDFGTQVINDTVVFPEGYSLKENLLACYDVDGKNVYTLGTRHEYHFVEAVNYSIQDLQSVIDNVKPDYLFIECREETFDKYQALDGPHEMLFLYAYGKEHGIEVELIDYWQITNEIMAQKGSSWDERDNQIFYNIYDKMANVKKGETVLICYGSAHFFYQQPRMEMAGWKRVELTDTSSFFACTSEEFQYPECLPQIIQDAVDNYYTYGALEEAKANITYSEVMSYFEDITTGMAPEYLGFKKMVENNMLYISNGAGN